jgi:hypothetical protein
MLHAFPTADNIPFPRPITERLMIYRSKAHRNTRTYTHRRRLITQPTATVTTLIWHPRYRQVIVNSALPHRTAPIGCPYE